jgi:hypothetical protein
MAKFSANKLIVVSVLILGMLAILVSYAYLQQQNDSRKLARKGIHGMKKVASGKQNRLG